MKGKIKGESNERDHLFYSVNVTSSGIKVRAWIELLLTVQSKAGRLGGPAITDWGGRALSASELDDKLHFYLRCLYEEGIEFPVEITSIEDVSNRFSIFRSLRRASDTMALERKVAHSDIDVVNRWKTVEKDKGHNARRPIRQHCAEVANLKLPFLRYTKAM